MKKMLINFFRKPREVCIVGGIIVGMIVAFLYFKSMGVFIPPNESDFYELHNQEKTIIENFDNVYNYENAEIYTSEKEIIVKLVSQESANYILKMTFSKDKKFISSEEISEKLGYRTYPVDDFMEKTVVWAWLIGHGIAFGVALGGVALFIYELIVNIYKLIKKIIKKTKNEESSV